MRQVERSSSHVGSDNISEHHNHPKQSSAADYLNDLRSSPRRLCHSQIEYLGRHHSNLGTPLGMVLRHTVGLNTGPLLEIHMLFVAPSGHISRRPRRNGQLGIEGWSCGEPSDEGRTEDRRCLTKLEMVVVV